MMKVKSVVAAGVTAAMGAGIVMAGPSVARAYINEDGRGALAAGFRGVKSAHGGREIGTFVVNGQRVVCIDPGKATPSDLGRLGKRTDAKASYLMDQYANTTNDYEAAALDYIINVDYGLGSDNRYLKNGWAGAKHLSQMQAARNKLLADANSHAGPYRLSVSLAPKKAYVGDKGLASWAVTSASGASWNGAKVRVVLHGPAAFDGGSSTVTGAAKGRSGFTSTGPGWISASAQTTGTVPDTTVKIAAAKVRGQQRVVLAGDRATVRGVAPRVQVSPKPITMTSDLTDTADGDHAIVGGKAATLSDKVAYSNAAKGTTYTLSGELVDKTSGKSTGIKASKTFTAAGASGSVTVPFRVSAHDAGVWSGHTVVAYEILSDTSGKKLAAHTDLADARQSVSVSKLVPKLSSQASDTADGDQMIPAGKDGRVRDAVAYQGLVPGERYTVSGQLMDSTSGKPVSSPVSTPLTASTTDGTIEVTLPVPAKQGAAGHRLVVFETLSDTSGQKVASDADLTNLGQSMWAPKIGTTAVDKADGDHVLPAEGGTVTDTIAYHGFQPGLEYTLSGELVDKASGKNTGIKASKVFTAAKADGSVPVDFRVPAGFAGKQLVAFEVVKQNGHEVAAHTEINDVNQSMSVTPPAPTPTPSVTPAALVPASTPPTPTPSTPPASSHAATPGGQIHTGDVPDGLNPALIAVGATITVAGGVGAGIAARRRRD